jgi:hypothetical protein
MSRVSPEFGKLVKKFLQDRGLTFRAAGLQSSISAAYWKDMSDGRVPSEEVIKRISQSFDGMSEIELLMSAGYAPKPGQVDSATAVEVVLRGQTDLSDEAKQQILDYVKGKMSKSSKKG